MKYNIQTQHRQAQAQNEAYKTENMDTTISAIPFALPSSSNTTEQANSDWVGPFVENELSHFEYQDDDWDINDDFTIEEQLALFGDLSDAWQGEEAEQDAILVSEYSQQQEEDLRYQLSLNENMEQVLCPICMQNFLVQNDVCISCVCGLRQDIFFQNMDLELLGHNMDMLRKKHSQNCPQNLEFFCEENELASYLFVGCNACGMHESVL